MCVCCFVVLLLYRNSHFSYSTQEDCDRVSSAESQERAAVLSSLHTHPQHPLQQQRVDKVNNIAERVRVAREDHMLTLRERLNTIRRTSTQIANQNVDALESACESQRAHYRMAMDRIERVNEKDWEKEGAILRAGAEVWNMTIHGIVVCLF
jgi:histidinol dehydrogenase